MSRNQPASTSSFTLSRSGASSLQPQNHAISCIQKSPEVCRCRLSSRYQTLRDTSTLLPLVLSCGSNHLICAKNHSGCKPSGNCFSSSNMQLEATADCVTFGTKYMALGNQKAPQDAGDPVSQVHDTHSSSTVPSEQHMSGPGQAPPCE